MFNGSSLLGNLLQGGGIGGRSTGRLDHAMSDRGMGGAGGPLGGLLGGMGGSSGGMGGGYGGGSMGSGGGGLGGLLGGLTSSGPAMGGLGALAGAMMGGRGMGGGMTGGSMGGALGGGALGLLGMMAMKALSEGGQKPAVAAPDPRMAAAGAYAPPERALSEDAALLVVRAMIEAAKADGQIDATERQRIVAKVQENGGDREALDYLEREMQRPLDMDGLVAEARDPVVGAQVYAASLLAIKVDTPSEQAYLRDLAARLGLQPATVAQLHQALGAPPV